MRRREFIAGLGGATVWPLAALAQQPKYLPRVGLLMNRPASDRDAQASAAAFNAAFEKIGWSHGRNVQIEYRWAPPEAKALRAAAVELVRLKPNVIVASATDGLKAVRGETRTVPIVFVSVSDPVRQGFVASLAHPGGNITGITAFEFSMGGKWMQILKEAAPFISKVAVVFNPVTAPYFSSFLQSIESAAKSFGVESTAVPVSNVDQIEPAIMATVGAMGKGGLIFPSDAFAAAHRDKIIEIAARNRLPAIYAFRFFTSDGGLISYGVDRLDLYRQAAPYVDRILKGAKPDELPVQQPTKFELAINLKTAKVLGLTVPTTLLARADEVIE